MGKGNKLENVAIRLVEAPPLYSREALKGPVDVVRVLGKELEMYDREVLCVVNLKASLAPINMNVVSMGSINQSIVTAREVFKSSILSNAACIMLVHNHPSGDITPSKSDMAVTKQIEKAAEFMDIPLIDHIILGGHGDFFSFRSNGLMAIDKEHLVQMAAEKTSICGEIRENQRREEKKGADGQEREARGLAGRADKKNQEKTKGEGR